MAETKLTKKEIADLRIRLEEERIQLDGQLATIEEDSFASTQSDAAGDVGLDDEPADAGTATFEREKDLSIENNVRDLLHKIDRAAQADRRRHLRHLRHLRQAHREGAGEGAPVRGSLHQGRPGAVAAVGAVTRHGRSAGVLFAVAGAVWLLDRLSKIWVEHALAGRPPVTIISGVLDLRFTTNPGGAFSLGQRAPWIFVGASIVVSVAIIATSFRHTNVATSVALGLDPRRRPRQPDRPDRPRSGILGARGRFRRLPRLAGLQPGGFGDRGGRHAAGRRLVRRGPRPRPRAVPRCRLSGSSASRGAWTRSSRGWPGCRGRTCSARSRPGGDRRRDGPSEVVRAPGRRGVGDRDRRRGAAEPEGPAGAGQVRGRAPAGDRQAAGRDHPSHASGDAPARW